MTNWLEREDLKFLTQLLNFAEAIPTYASTFGLTPAQITAISNDADFASFVITRLEQADNYKQNWVKLKDQVRYGTGGRCVGTFPNSYQPSGCAPGGAAKRRETLSAKSSEPSKPTLTTPRVLAKRLASKSHTPR